MICLGEFEIQEMKKHVKTLDQLNIELNDLYKKIELICAVTDASSYDVLYNDIKAVREDIKFYKRLLGGVLYDAVLERR